MKTIRINASFSDCIDGLVDPESLDVPKWVMTIEVVVDNENKSDEIIALFKECISFNIKEDSIFFILKSTQEEIDSYIDRRNGYTAHGINRLHKWMNTNKEWDIQITEYLEFKGLQWVLDKLKEKE